MADKQTGTGARGNSQRRPKGQGSSESGNHTRTSSNNRSQQKKGTNRSESSNDQNTGRSGANQ